MNEPVKALSIASYPFLPPKMGGEKGIALFNRYLAPLLELHCVTTSANKISGNEGYHILPVLSKSKSKTRYINPLLFFRLKRIIKELGITHVILEHPYYGWLGVMLKWFCKVKLVIHSHNIEATRFRSIGMWWGILWNYEKWTHRQAHSNFFIQDDDKAYAIQRFGLDPARCFTITYGIEMETAPSAGERQAARKVVAAKYGIAGEEKILLFNGSLDYKPNLDALKIILDEINPILLSAPAFKYKFIICGKNLPETYQQLTAYADKHIIYAGFVEDIDLYFKAADIFINPVTDGGGIKTKLVEALAHNLNVVTTQSGAIGVPVELTGGKMTVLKDDELSLFATEIMKTNTSASIPASFFDHFYWGHIAKKAAAAMGSSGS